MIILVVISVTFITIFEFSIISMNIFVIMCVVQVTVNPYPADETYHLATKQS